MKREEFLSFNPRGNMLVLHGIKKSGLILTVDGDLPFDAVRYVVIKKGPDAKDDIQIGDEVLMTDPSAVAVDLKDVEFEKEMYIYTPDSMIKFVKPNGTKS